MAELGSNKRVALLLCVVVLTASAACAGPPTTPEASASTAPPSIGPGVPETVPAPAPIKPDIYNINPDTEKASVLLRAPGAQTNAELSPDGKRVVYESTSGGPSQIFVLKADGTTQQLTQGKRGAHDPSWSPDGSQIAFASSPRRGSDSDIFVMNADGSHIRRLVGTGRNDGHPDWSPDGSRIAFHSRYENHGIFRGGIWVTSVHTRTLTRLIGGHHYWNGVDPAWSPDGRWIAYVRLPGSTINGHMPYTELWLMRPNGTRGSRIVKRAWALLHQNPSWSPDGRSIVVERSDWEEGVDRVLVTNARTGRTRTLLGISWDWYAGTNWGSGGILVSLALPLEDETKAASRSTGAEDLETGPPLEPTDRGDIYIINHQTGKTSVLLRAPGVQTNAELSPDGTRLLYESVLDETPQIFMMEAGGTTQQVTHRKRGAHDPTWSPDGSRIAFASRPRKRSDTDIFVMNADGSRIQRLVGTARDDGHPGWSPDGSRIAFHTRYWGYKGVVPVGMIWVASARARTFTRLTRSDIPFGGVDPAWSPDGRWIAYSSFSRSTFNGRIVEAALWLMRPDGTHKRRIGKPAEFGQLSENPSWSPNGSWIVFEYHPGPLQAISVRTERLREFHGIGGGGPPSWSPRGILVSLWD